MLVAIMLRLRWLSHYM